MEAPVYTREELDSELEKLVLRIKHMLEDFNESSARLSRVEYELNRDLSVSTRTVSRFHEILEELRSALQDAIDEMVVNRLRLDTDIEKYERAFNVKFDYESERQLGVALLREGGELKPVVVWTDYSRIGYYEGKRE